MRGGEYAVLIVRQSGCSNVRLCGIRAPDGNWSRILHSCPFPDSGRRTVRVSISGNLVDKLSHSPLPVVTCYDWAVFSLGLISSSRRASLQNFRVGESFSRCVQYTTFVTGVEGCACQFFHHEIYPRFIILFRYYLEHSGE